MGGDADALDPHSTNAWAAWRLASMMDESLIHKGLLVESGAPVSRIIGKHLFPNVLAPVLVYATTIVGLLSVFTATLSFLGLGVAPPAPEWGLMVDEGRRVLSVAPHIATLPGILIFITSLCFNLVGDGLRYALDPRQHTK